ncbi:protein Z-dependent protease inhibitor isoform X1 [Arvicola amphibius]|uniref:protein Z-dependent protease inhibitor isoform X1 n=1 Tax=Arvicola amphibius TaxID=1047088 RepID=UPI0018E33124|nr:protein Z-dependent protease inhibitor isoform X1 [Arvicola amphibius]XP_038191640.1 protein Z-dependent protease inhibitor isoform X1 [Arvicola amphibius]
MKWPLASTAEHMRAASSLLLPVLLAEVCLVTSLNFSSHLPEAQAELESQHPQNQTWVPSDEEEEEYWLRTSQQQLSNETSNFGFSLLRKISMRHDGNVIFSPFGLSVVMVNLMLGAKGETKVQVENGLHLQALSQAEPRILPSLFKRLRETLSNSQELDLTQGSFAFIHKDFDIKETYLNLSKKYFDTECVPTNFRNSSQAKGLMNYYINKETRGKIPKLFDEINPETKLILVDYILFKGPAYTEERTMLSLRPLSYHLQTCGPQFPQLLCLVFFLMFERGKWLTPFDPVSTEADNFHLDKYKAVKVPMMYQEGNFASTFDKKFRCHILKLPYQGNATMLVVLMEKTGDHLALEDYLTIDLVETWLQNMKTRKMEVFFPKFKLDQRYEMHKLLQQMGIRRIFSTSADLSELSAVARNLQVSKVLQQSVLEVDERGTEAVAGTLSEIVAYSMPPVIKVNRPFHFMIYEEMSKMLLFLGRVVNPTVL